MSTSLTFINNSQIFCFQIDNLEYSLFDIFYFVCEKAEMSRLSEYAR